MVRQRAPAWQRDSRCPSEEPPGVETLSRLANSLSPCCQEAVHRVDEAPARVSAVRVRRRLLTKNARWRAIAAASPPAQSCSAAALGPVPPDRRSDRASTRSEATTARTGPGRAPPVPGRIREAPASPARKSGGGDGRCRDAGGPRC